jgi:hypothetical protein
MNLRFKHAAHDLRRRGDGVVHVRGPSSIVMCQPNLVGAPVEYTDDPPTCLRCTAIREASRATRNGVTHAVRWYPTTTQAGLTRCVSPFQWSYAQPEAHQMNLTDQEVDCMACIATEATSA